MVKPFNKRDIKKPEGDDFLVDMKNAKKAAAQTAKKTEERFSKVTDEVTGLKVVAVPLELLEDAPWQDETYDDIRNQIQLFQETKDSMMTEGLQQPIVIWEKENKDGYIILSGHSRKRVYESLYKDDGIEAFKQIPAFIKPFESLDEAQAIGQFTAGNLKRDDSDEATRILVLYMNIKRFEKKAEKFFYENPGKYERIRDVLGEMIGKDGKTVDNVKGLGKLGRKVVELLNTTPLRQKDLLNPIIRKNKDLQEELIANQEKITSNFVKQITKSQNADDVIRALHGASEEPLTPPDTITIELPEGKGDKVVTKLTEFLIELGFNSEDYDVKLKKKRKKTAKPQP